MIKIIQSTNGSNMLVYNNFVFRIDKIRADRVLWRCNIRDCKARGFSAVDYMNNLASFNSHGDHNHPASLEYITKSEKRSKIKKNMTGSNDGIRKIIGKALRGGKCRDNKSNWKE